MTKSIRSEWPRWADRGFYTLTLCRSSRGYDSVCFLLLRDFDPGEWETKLEGRLYGKLLPIDSARPAAAKRKESGGSTIVSSKVLTSGMANSPWTSSNLC